MSEHGPQLPQLDLEHKTEQKRRAVRGQFSRVNDTVCLWEEIILESEVSWSSGVLEAEWELTGGVGVCTPVESSS